MQEHDDVQFESDMHEDVGQSESEVVEEEARAEAKMKKLKDELEACKKEKQEYLDGWQRAKADYVNALKRSEADIKAAKAGGLAKAVETLLPGLDALERAKEHGEVPPGFQAIAKQLESSFAALGLTALGTVGEAFNPMLHEAFGQDPAASKETDDTITAVLEKGWRVGDTVIRPAKVRVAHFE